MRGKSPFAQYQGGGSALPAGYLEAAMRPGQAIAAGISEASKGIAEGIKKYAENNEQSLFLNERFNNLKPYLDQMMKDDKSDFFSLHGKQIGLDLDKFSKSGLGSKKAILADMEFMIKRYDVEKGYDLKEQEMAATAAKAAGSASRDEKKIQLAIQANTRAAEANARAEKQLQYNLGAGTRAAATASNKAQQEAAETTELAAAMQAVSGNQIMGLPAWPGGVGKGNREGVYNAARGSLTTPDNMEALNKFITASEEAESGMTIGALTDVPGFPGVKTIATSPNQVQLLFPDQSKVKVSPSIQANLQQVLGPEQGYNEFLQRHSNIAPEAMKIRRAHQLSLSKGTGADLTKNILTMKSDIRKQKRLRQPGKTNDMLESSIKDMEESLAEMEAATRQPQQSSMAPAPTQTTPAAPAVDLYWNVKAGQYQPNKP